MKQHLSFLTAVVLFLLPAMLVAQDGEPFITKTYKHEKVSKVYARTSGGSISVDGGSDVARVEVFIKGNGRKFTESELKDKLLEDYRLVINVEDNKLIVTAEPQRNYLKWRDALTISFKIYVPREVSTDLATSGGSINMRNLDGTQSFSTSGGSLRLDKLAGKIKGRTSGGSIDVTNTSDEIDLSTSGGSVAASYCKGRIKLTTSGGSIKFDNLGGDIEVHTSGGNIRGSSVKGELTAHTSGGGVDLQHMECSLNASTSGGNIQIGVDRLAEYVTVKNSGGNIRVTLPSDKGVDLKLRGDHINLENMSNFSGNKEDHKVDGRVNGGGIPIDIQTSGRITVALD